MGKAVDGVRALDQSGPAVTPQLAWPGVEVSTLEAPVQGAGSQLRDVPGVDSRYGELGCSHQQLTTLGQVSSRPHAAAKARSVLPSARALIRSTTTNAELRPGGRRRNHHGLSAYARRDATAPPSAPSTWAGGRPRSGAEVAATGTLDIHRQSSVLIRK